jgi:acetyl-CoA/propionyl-CoA carboxylase, biotin carboxylase, biotin carboxyl carrier protein
VLPFHRAVVDDPAFTSEPFTVHTGWIEDGFRNDLPPYAGEVASANGSGAPERERFTVEVGGKRLEVVLPADLVRAGAGSAQAAQRPAPSRRRGGGKGGGGGSAGGDALVSPMQGTIVKIVAEEGRQVSAGDTVVVLEAMKMEQPLSAHKDGTVTDLAVQVGQTVSSGEIICQLRG